MLNLNKQESKSWLAGYQCCVVIYTSISFGLILVTVFNQVQSIQSYADWDNYLIKDIQIKQNFDEGFSNILNFTWPGTEKVCDCTQSNSTSIYKYKKYEIYHYSSYYYMDCSQFMLQHIKKQMEKQQFIYWPFLQQSVERGNHCLYYLKDSKSAQKESVYSDANILIILKYGEFRQYLNVPIASYCPISHFNMIPMAMADQLEIPVSIITIKELSRNKCQITHFTIGYSILICYLVTRFYLFFCCKISNFYYLDNMNDYKCYLITVSEQSFKLIHQSIWTNLQLIKKQSFYLKSSRCEFILYMIDQISIVQISRFRLYIQFEQLLKRQCNGHLIGCIGDSKNIGRCIWILIPIISTLFLSRGFHFKNLFGFWLGTKMIGVILCTIILAVDLGYQQFIINHFYDFINADCLDTLNLYELYNYLLLNFILYIDTNVTDIYLNYLMCRDKYKKEQLQ
ncbi:unnamed protein product (macronuclear) [Paramecium tetraurelia]|uniref:Uncharacterized protein n=1 Tax=Paramecium tetraurelia TaxID=5888 RepID=A0DNH5_PARTE|nr:uncharacterized protein GSPATT00018788001 [Paramecium tetraurelia]CAK84592.1 unnamed protein product [Paramecium tetraurelia]|eukprot:XP_001451989.1 hypothetical protein (macronuclear) [Paramecium tetraurelia strain d4-2]